MLTMIDAVKFLKTLYRMCGYYTTNCGQCPLSSWNNDENIGCRELKEKYPEKAVEIVKAWAKEHPEKTYVQDLMEKFPNMALNDVGIPCPCRAYLYNKENKCIHHNGNCAECWNEPMEV